MHYSLFPTTFSKMPFRYGPESRHCASVQGILRMLTRRYGASFQYRLPGAGLDFYRRIRLPRFQLLENGNVCMWR